MQRMTSAGRRSLTATLLLGGGVLLGLLGFRHLALEREQTDRRARALEQRRLAEAVANAPRLARQPAGGPEQAWQLEPGTLRGTDAPLSAELAGALENARSAAPSPLARLTRWQHLASDDRPAWLRHIASYHAGVAALALRDHAEAERRFRVALEAHPLLVSDKVRVRAASLQHLALAGLARGATGPLDVFLTAALDGRRLTLGGVVGPDDLLVELEARVREDGTVLPRALDERLDKAAQRAADGIALLRAVPKRGDLALVDGRVAHHDEIELQVHGLQSLVAPPPGFEARVHAAVDPTDVSADPLRARLAAPFSAVVLTVEREPLQAKSLLALVGLALGLGFYVVGAVLALRGWRRSRDAARMQADFTAAVSHEMKTPIASVRAMAEMLAQGDATLAQRYAPRIEGEMQRLGATVRNVLDAAQIERGTLPVHLQPGDPAGVAQRAAEAQRPGLERRGLTLVTSIEPAAAAQPLDADALEGVVANLLDNAGKFASDGGRVEVRGEAVAAGYRLAVLDRGPGLGSDDAESLFGRFQRGAAARMGAAPGVGLGLHIARQVIEAHGGTLDARDRSGGGAVFEIHLPVRDPA